VSGGGFLRRGPESSYSSSYSGGSVGQSRADDVPAQTPQQRDEAQARRELMDAHQLAADRNNTPAFICATLGISRTSFYRYLSKPAPVAAPSPSRARAKRAARKRPAKPAPARAKHAARKRPALHTAGAGTPRSRATTASGTLARVGNLTPARRTISRTVIGGPG
jgi:hypothetical protein